MVQFLSSTLSICCDSDCDFLSFLIHFLNLDLDALEPCTFSPSLHYEEPHMICFSLQRMPSGLLSIENSFPLLPHCYCHNRRLLGYRRTIDDFLVHLYLFNWKQNKTKQKHCALLFFLEPAAVCHHCVPLLWETGMLIGCCTLIWAVFGQWSDDLMNGTLPHPCCLPLTHQQKGPSDFSPERTLCSRRALNWSLSGGLN